MQRIFVGDVQGRADEFEQLVERARSEFGGEFELWLVGDLINRGPDNLRVLRRARELVESGRGRYVLGNHELGLLRIALGLQSLRPQDSYGDVLAAADADEWVEWLRRRPLVASGRLGRQRFALVHAATHPDWDLDALEAQAREVEARMVGDREDLVRLLGRPHARDSHGDVLERLTHCRSADPHGAWSSRLPELAPPGFEAWHRVWASRGHDYGVVYGHWALQGLHVAPGLRGLDTGCVHHGRGRDGLLTAWLPRPDAEMPFDVPDDAFWQIPARRVYYSPDPAPPSGSRGGGGEGD